MDLVYTSYKIANWFWRHKLTFISVIIRALMRIIFACDVPYKMQIGKGTIFPHHALGVILHPDVIIGENCKVLHEVTIGLRKGSKVVPVIGDNVYIGAGAKIIGPIKIGDNVEIGANAVVLHDVPDNAVVVGVPARVIKINGQRVENFK